MDFRVSASQVKNFETCERLWFLQSVEGIKLPPTRALALGTAVHSCFEERLLNAEPFPDNEAGAIAASAEKFLPDTNKIIGVEVALEGFEITGVPWAGVIDVLWRPNNAVAVLDWKTTSAERYAKTEKDLINDVQMLAYARYVRQKYNQRIVPISHVYVVTRGKRRAFSVDTVVDCDTTAERWGTVQKRVEKMKILSEGSREDANRNILACANYGGCPHKALCWAKKEKGPQMDMMAKLKALKGEAVVSEHKNNPIPDSIVVNGECSCGRIVKLTESGMTEQHENHEGKRCKSSGKKPIPTNEAEVFSSPVTPEPSIVPPDAAESKPKRAKTKKEEAPIVQNPGVELYIDCLPMTGGQATLLDIYLSEAAQVIADGANVLDYRLIDFGKGAAALAAYIRENPPKPGRYHVSSFSPAAKLALESLLPIASTIVKGV